MASSVPAPRKGSKSNASIAAKRGTNLSRAAAEAVAAKTLAAEALAAAALDAGTAQAATVSVPAPTSLAASPPSAGATGSGLSAACEQTSDAPKSWSRRARWGVSLLIAGHLAAVFLAPFTFASTPAPGVSDGSPAALAAMRWFHPYIEAMFLQHGYAFFAPDPGPSHLFRVKLEYADGRPSEELRFPDLRQHRPRLLYHRHFMLSERLWVGHVPSVAPPGLSENIDELMQWRRSRESYETYYHTLRDSYLEHLLHDRGAATAVLGRVEHRLAGVDEIRERRRRLNAPESYSLHPDDARLFAEVPP